MKVVLLGSGEMLANLIEGVNDSGFDIVGVFRSERTYMSKFRVGLQNFFKSSSAVTLIKNYHLHEIICKSANSEKFKNEILKLNADVIIVGSWREKLKKEIIDLPTIATINVHPSLLPNYKGPNPYVHTILNGEKYSGITFHLMDEKFDNGPILAQEKIDILPCDTARELKGKTLFRARVMVNELLHRLNTEIIQPVPQKEGRYYSNIAEDLKMLDFSKQTSCEIIRTVKALHPFLPTYVTVGSKFLTVNPYKVRLVDKLYEESDKIVAKCVKTRSLTIVCKDKKCVKFSDLKLYRFPLFTKFFIKYFVKI